ncbi:MAG: menaquinone biosynthesis protein [Bacteroidales bacterium]
MNISVVNYLNSAPLVYGVTHSGLFDGCVITADVPAVGAARLLAGEADLALVPVGAFPGPGEVEWIGDYCIGVEGPVRTVCLFSDCPPDQIRRVWLDPHSRTSVELIRILAHKYLNASWEFLPGSEGFENRVIQGQDAAVCIGDKVFRIEGRHPHKLDLAEEWIRFTGLPFVFAAWATRKSPDPGLVQRLNEAQGQGIASIPIIAREWSQKLQLAETEIVDYLTRNISFHFTEDKLRGLNLFHQYLNSSRPSL